MNSVLILVVSFWSVQQVYSSTKKEVATLQIYYKADGTPVPLMPVDSAGSEVVEVPTGDGGPMLRRPALRFGPLPCSCEGLTCGCCVNMRLQVFNFSRQACTNFTYEPYEFAIKMNMLWNEESIYNTSISGKNPPPFCLQVPVPYLPTMDQCVRVFNIFTPGRNIHMCMNLETRFERVPVLVLQFDCMRMGVDGVALLKPEDEGGLMKPEETTSESTEIAQEAENVFDTIDPDKKKNNQTVIQVTDTNNEMFQETFSVDGADFNITTTMAGDNEVTIEIDDSKPQKSVTNKVNTTENETNSLTPKSIDRKSFQLSKKTSDSSTPLV